MSKIFISPKRYVQGSGATLSVFPFGAGGVSKNADGMSIIILNEWIVHHDWEVDTITFDF